MKIVLATPIFPPESGGPGTYTCAIAERLSPKHDIVIVTYGDNPTLFTFGRVVAVKASANILLRWLRYTYILWKEMGSADVVYAQNAMASGFPAVIAGQLRAKPVVIKMVGDEAWERARQGGNTTVALETFLKNPDRSFRTRLFMGMQGFALRHAELVTAPAEYLLRVMRETYKLKEEKTEVNVNAAEVENIPTVTRKQHSIAVVARLTLWKNVAGVLLALPLVQKSFPDATLKIAGDGPERPALLALVDRLSLQNSVTFLGAIPKHDVTTLLASSHVFVLNSHYEGMPHVVLESFAAETPVVATQIEGTDEVVEHQKNGLLVAAGDDEALAASIIRIFKDNALAEKLREGGSRSLSEKFSYERHVTKLEEFFTRVTKA